MRSETMDEKQNAAALIGEALLGSGESEPETIASLLLQGMGIFAAYRVQGGLAHGSAEEQAICAALARLASQR